jgi:Redoxin.
MLRHRNEYPVEGRVSATAFDAATTWLNSPPLTPAGLAGRVFLVSFGTYTCINWLRSLPYVRAWFDKYASKGLVVVGINTPEFEFEGNLENVERAIKEMDVRYPIAVDNDYAIWQALDNHYWPALYFVDPEGQIRHHHFGEGEYEESEMVLQMLLRAAGADVEQGLVEIVPGGAEAAADWYSLGSAETYLGYRQASGFASPVACPSTSPTPTRCPRSCGATSGPSRATGGSGRCLCSSTSPGGRSPSSSTPVTSTW